MLRAAVDSARAVARLRQVEPFAVDGASAEELAAGAALLEVLDEDGQAVGALAVDVAGEVATITAAAGRCAHTWEELGALESACRSIGVKRLRLLTRRPGLVRQLTREGYAIAACEMQKDL
jgi:hypothetical protein